MSVVRNPEGTLERFTDRNPDLGGSREHAILRYLGVPPLRRTQEWGTGYCKFEPDTSTGVRDARPGIVSSSYAIQLSVFCTFPWSQPRSQSYHRYENDISLVICVTVSVHYFVRNMCAPPARGLPCTHRNPLRSKNQSFFFVVSIFVLCWGTNQS